MSSFIIPLYHQFTKSIAYNGTEGNSVGPLSPTEAGPLAAAFWKLEVHLSRVTIKSPFFLKLEILLLLVTVDPEFYTLGFFSWVWGGRGSRGAYSDDP